MANSAQYLLQLFNEEPREEGETFDLRRVMLAVGDVDRQLNGLIALGVSRFEAYRKGMPELWEKSMAHIPERNECQCVCLHAYQRERAVLRCSRHAA